jgi:hypothetical protein
MTLLPFHILAGILALLFGYVALYATKGATLHRRSGIFLSLLFKRWPCCCRSPSCCIGCGACAAEKPFRAS